MDKRYYMKDDFETGSRKPKTTGIIFVCIFLLIIVLIGLYVLGASSKKSSSPIVPTATVTPTTIPVVTRVASPTAKISISVTPTGKAKTSPTPTPLAKGAVDRSKLEITVLNGSGIAGAAKGISSYLSDLGYTIKTVGNASTYDYKGLTILVTKANSSYLAVLKKDLAQKSASISASIDDTLTTGAEVIVGK